MKEQYVVYVTICLVNNKLYVGDHCIKNNKNDHYVGSGLLFLHALKNTENIILLD
jgi:hypothetical protein